MSARTRSEIAEKLERENAWLLHLHPLDPEHERTAKAAARLRRELAGVDAGSPRRMRDARGSAREAARGVGSLDYDPTEF